MTKIYSHFLMFYGKVTSNLIYSFTIFKHEETQLEELRKSKNVERGRHLTPKHYFLWCSYHRAYTPSARFQCEGTLLRAV